VPFCLALAMHREPEDPRSFDETALHDEAIATTCAAIELHATSSLPTAWSARMTVTLADGRLIEIMASSFKGMPADPFNDDDLQRRFLLLTQGLDKARALAWRGQLARLWEEPRFPAY
jgi:2-methylcitrate dehydratase PrpD